VSRIRRFRLLEGLLLTAVSLALASCDRKAPSADECLGYALVKLRINDQRLLAVPEVKDQVDSIVISCLTTPYDKELIKCVKRRFGSNSCLLEFRDREQRRLSTRN